MNYFLALLSIASFSLTVPFTRLATQSLDPMAVAGVRLIGAALLCVFWLGLFDRWVPPKSLWFRILCVSLGSVIGFTFFISMSMKHVPSTHGGVALAALPALTAAYGSLRDRMSQSLQFWIFCGIGTLITLSFFASNVSGHLGLGDLYLIGAVITTVYGYVEGARLSREHGGRRIMSWAIIFAAPIALLIFGPAVLRTPLSSITKQTSIVGALTYLATVSQSLGMFLWFHVLAKGPLAKVAMIQLLQPFCTFLAAWFFFQEEVAPLTWWLSIAVAVCVFGAQRSRRQEAIS